MGDLLVCLEGESRSQAEDECSGIHCGLLALVWEEEEEEEEERGGKGEEKVKEWEKEEKWEDVRGAVANCCTCNSR